MMSEAATSTTLAADPPRPDNEPIPTPPVDRTTPMPRPTEPHRDHSLRGALRRSGGVGLRRRILLTFTLGSLTLSAFLAVTTYGLVRSNLIEQRYSANRQAAYSHAQVVLRELRTEPPTSAGASEELRQIGVQRPVIYYNGVYSAGMSRFGSQELPPALVTDVIEETTPSRMIAEAGGETVMVFGIPLPEAGAYFEFFDLGEDNETLSNVALSLFLAGVITTLLGVFLGVFAARRAVRPVAEAAQAAKAIAGGHLGTRLPPSDDPDLGVLAGSFNDMASALQLRIERDARFASDVSHELRSPLMTLSASVEVMEARRQEMPERAQAALDLLSSDVSRFQGLVEDLLEISRFDAGAIRLHLEDLQVTQFVRNAVAVSAAPSTDIVATDRAEHAIIRGDRRRLARALANLIDNANAYGGGEPAVTIADANLPDEPLTHVQVAVEDHGPGRPGRGARPDLRALRPRRDGRPAQRQRGCRTRSGPRRRARADPRRPGVGRGSSRRLARGPLRRRAAGPRARAGAGADRPAGRRRPGMTAGRRLVAAALVCLTVTACSIQPDTAPRAIPPDERGLLDPVTPEGGEAAGSTRVFLVVETGEGDPQLRSVQRGVDATPSAALEELFKGANDQEDEAGLGTAIPDGLALLGARPVAGTLQVDVGEEILDLPGQSLILAVAQIVLTASELDGVREVRLKVNGQNRPWPDGRGELRTETLTVYDYPGLAESSQPAYPPIPSGTVVP